MKSNKQSKTYCPLPFIHPFLSISGQFKPCCNVIEENPDDLPTLYNSDYTLSTWFHSDQMHQLRSDLNNEIKNSMCDVCWNREDAGLPDSPRKQAIDRFGYLDTSQEPVFKYLDLKLSNICNLQCRMCNGRSSNRISLEVNKLQEQGLTIPKNYENSWFKNADNDTGIYSIPSNIIQDIKQHSNTIEVLKFTGGEPAIQSEVLEILDYFNTNNHSKNVTLYITTNGTKFNKEFLKLTEPFKQIRFNISVDGEGTTYNYIRYPFNWKKFIERLDYLRSTVDFEYARPRQSSAKHYTINYTCIPQMLNIENLPKLQEVLGHEYLILNSPMHPRNIWNSLDIVPKNILQKTKDNLISHQCNRVLRFMIDKILQDDTVVSNERKIEMYKSVCSLDLLRNQSYKNYLEPLTVKFINQYAETV